jgi:general secretion pathway protein B
MSFILDALKKSESDRQRKNGPALFEVKVAPRRTRLPLWGIALALLLAVNLVILAWMLLRHPTAHANAALETPGSPPAAASVPASTVSAALPAAAPPTSVTAAPPSPAPAVTAVPASAVKVPAPVAALPNNSADEQNPEDLAPATEPIAAPLSSHVRRGTADGVPLYQDWAATSGTSLPQLRLDLHVYAARPEERFVMINMHKLREGDSLPEGVRVDGITPEGAVLSYNGARFLLPRD